jgi:single-stranded-DNA-specific exonuclease
VTYHRWDVAVPDPAATASLEKAGYLPLAARTLVLRGISSPEEAADFFKLRPDSLHDPFLLPDMDKAVSRLRLAAERGEVAAVYGDYDADGVTATAVMVRTLKELGIKCLWHIPDRGLDGYGLNIAAIEALAGKGVSLIVTVDNGISSHAEVEAAKAIGVDVIITDHHECRDTLPGAAAVVNPRRPDSRYPFSGLAGVGVAFKLVCALTGGWKPPLIKFADIVALGTVADIMPVTGENRLLITQGLRAMPQTKNHGLYALLAETEHLDKPITADTIAYTLAPRINAAGRVGNADTALELLLTDDPAEAAELARSLCEMNLIRQSREADITRRAEKLADPSASALVLYDGGWQIGVAGIVAARMTEIFERPVFIACVEGDTARGSARGIPGVNLTELLAKHAHLLETYGGHGMAAGFRIKKSNLETFRAAMEAECSSLIRQERVLQVDAEVKPEWLDLEGMLALEALAPFGVSFAQPVFSMKDAVLTDIIPIGGGKHLRLAFEKEGRRLEAVWFNKTQETLGITARRGTGATLAFKAEVNRFRGQEQVQLRIIDIKQGEV